METISLDLSAIFTAFIMAIPSAVLTLFVWKIQKNTAKRDKLKEENETKRDEYMCLLVKMAGANMSLSEAVAIAQKNNKSNGETTKALEYAQQVKHNHKDFLTEIGVKSLFD